MKLLTKEILNKIPGLYGQERKDIENTVLYVKFFAPWGNWTWYGAEYDPEERMFFGFVEGFEGEWGYFSLDELESIKGPFGLKIERDKWWTPKSFEKCGFYKKYKKEVSV